MVENGRSKRHEFKRIDYKRLDSKQKEAFNFQKVSAVLAEYGFITIRLSSDWKGADFIAQHHDGVTFLKVQLKGRLTFQKQYIGRELHICFPYRGQWFLYPHDEFLQEVLTSGLMVDSRSWESGEYSFPKISKNILRMLEPHRIEERVQQVQGD
jgi:hypothetical protein